MCNLNMNGSGRETGEQETPLFIRGATDRDVKRTKVVKTDIRKGRTLEGEMFGGKISHHRLNRLSASFSAKDTIKTNRTEDRMKLQNSILLLDKCAKIIVTFMILRCIWRKKTYTSGCRPSRIMGCFKLNSRSVKCLIRPLERSRPPGTTNGE